MPPKRTLIQADALSVDFPEIPERSGVYLFYLDGGTRLLDRTGYFDTDLRSPLARHGRTHLYTGAAHNLRLRMKQHLDRDWRGSTFRKSLLAVEFARQAISRSRTPFSKVSDEQSLTMWLRSNMTVELQFTDTPFERERRLIKDGVSPLNITLRRDHPYSQRLMAWRMTAFPP